MSEFIFLYRSSETTVSPEQMQKTEEKWTVWCKELWANGHLKARGNPLERTGKVIKGRQKSITDGPYAEVKDVVGGYTIIEVENITEAMELAKGCPILDTGGSVEVRPVQNKGEKQ